MKLFLNKDLKIISKLIIDCLEFEESSLEEADYLLSCYFYRTDLSNSYIQNMLDRYSTLQKAVIIFLISNNSDKFNIPKNVFFFRTSLFKSQCSENEFILPYVWEEIDRSFQPLDRTKLPIVGFCGNVDKYRKKLIEKIQNTPGIIANFILRKSFWGGKAHDNKLKNDFINNICSSHFTICNRGNGNFSMRFYQVLSAGRIPVLIDTDMLFPFEDEIPWNDIIIIGRNEEDVINKIFHWWKYKDIPLLQIKCKEIYINYFEKKTYFKRAFSICEIKKNNFNNQYKDTNNLINYLNKYPVYKIPEDFNIDIYRMYNDLSKMDNYNLFNHYVEKGILENRIYKLPDNFDINIYRLYNDLSKFSDEQFISHYINYGQYENRIYKLPENFNINKYKVNEDLSNFTDEQLIIHYINYGQYENRIIN